MSVVTILVDALRSDYLTEENMPFLYSKLNSSTYVKSVKPSFGFCERTEIFTGMYPNNSGNFTAIGYDSINSEYKKFRYVLKLISVMMLFFGEKSYISKGLNRLVKKLLKIFGIKLKPYNIPIGFLHKLRLTEDRFIHYDKGAFSNESIFDVMKKNNKTVYAETFTSLGQKKCIPSDIERVNVVVNKISKGYDLILLYIGEIDTMGHLHTDNISLMNRSLAKVDKYIEEVWRKLEDEDTNNTIVVIGDHGMVPVEYIVDLKREFRNLPLKVGKDYDFFLDSTIARFWFYRKDSRDYIIKILNSSSIKSKGFILDEKTAFAHKVPFKHMNDRGEHLYGDLIWCAHPGVIINPDYFNSEKNIKGMHGYADMSNIEGQGLLVVSNQTGANKIEQCNLVDICPTLCDLMNIEYPLGNEGKSILKNN